MIKFAAKPWLTAATLYAAQTTTPEIKEGMNSKRKNPKLNIKTSTMPPTPRFNPSLSVAIIITTPVPAIDILSTNSAWRYLAKIARGKNNRNINQDDATQRIKRVLNETELSI